MTEAPISPLRRRMIEDMTIRKFAPRTQEGYIRAVKAFSAFFGASPDKASFEDLRRYQLHLVASFCRIAGIFPCRPGAMMRLEPQSIIPLPFGHPQQSLR